jgi:hypothetical protein
MSGILPLLGLIGSTLLSLWAAFKYLLTSSYRLEDGVSKLLLSRIRKEKPLSWMFGGEHVTPPRFPELWEGFLLLDKIPLYFHRNERLMTAGWKSKESVTTLTFFRWNRTQVDNLLVHVNTGESIQVSALTPHGADRLGELEPGGEGELYLNPGSYEDIEADVKRVLAGDLNKTGALLHGSPGNGKTRFVRYLSKKYSLPINVVYFLPDYSNLDISLMFANIPQRSIVLLEDFDSLFDGRKCMMPSDQVKFTFDSLINSLDGVHNDYRQVVFIMTVNDIGKVDDSIKERPSRFKFVKEFGPPNASVRLKILQDHNLTTLTAGLTLDKVFHFKKNETF